MMNLTAQVFYDVILVPNVADQHHDEGNLRHAVNAIASLDDYIGIWAHELLKSGRTPLEEEFFRDELASRSEAYRILRDMAYSLKHGELNGKKARLVTKAESLQKQRGVFSPQVFSPNVFQTEDVICIETEDGRSKSVWRLMSEAMLHLTDLQNELA